MEDSQPQQLHIAICPFLAFGHLLPWLELADRLASRGHLVSYVSTPRNISRLPPAVAPLVSMVALPLPRVEGLPEGAESTNDISPDMVELHWIASDGLATPFSDFLGASKKKPDWVLADTLCHWAAAAAGEHQVPCAGLFMCGAAVLAAPPPDADAGWTKQFASKDASGLSVAERCAMTLQACRLTAFRSCLDLEPDSVAALTSTTGNGGDRPYVALGLLPPDQGRHSSSSEEVRWLDAQPPKSVLYVALGSEVPLRAEQVRELALGLELAGTRFLWALRKPHGLAADADVLPPGFEERTRGRGLVAMGWVSQLSVLAHGSVAAFLTHCGWGSTIEGLLFGHPLVMLPMGGDQWPNATTMEGRGIGVRVARHGDDGSSFHREGVATAIRAVTAAEGGAVFAANAKKLQQIVADRERHERCIDGFIQHLKSHS